VHTDGAVLAPWDLTKALLVREFNIPPHLIDHVPVGPTLRMYKVLKIYDAAIDKKNAGRRGRRR
jgi:hypothetical protein